MGAVLPRRVSRTVILLIALAVAGCGLVARYDSYFDQSLNTLAEDTAKFTAAASAGGNERNFASKEAVAYYAATYDLLDRLAARARLARGAVACPNNANLATLSQRASSSSPLPDDYASFDCLEHQLYVVRFYVDQMKYVHGLPGGLNRGRARADGGVLQVSIRGAIQTFLTGKP